MVCRHGPCNICPWHGIVLCGTTVGGSPHSIVGFMWDPGRGGVGGRSTQPPTYPPAHAPVRPSIQVAHRLRSLLRAQLQLPGWVLPFALPARGAPAGSGEASRGVQSKGTWRWSGLNATRPEARTRQSKKRSGKKVLKGGSALKKGTKAHSRGAARTGRGRASAAASRDGRTSRLEAPVGWRFQ